jgi:hypothetical protein
MKYVPDELVQRITASGTPAEVKAKVREYIKYGATCPILYPLGDVKLMIDTFAMRQDKVEAAEPFLIMMDDVYALQVTVDFPDAVTMGLRRQTDVLRSVLERTRGDLTMAMRQEKMRAALRHFEETVRAGGGGDEPFALEEWDEAEE